MSQIHSQYDVLIEDEARLRVAYIPLAQAAEWEWRRNAKLHDLEALKAAIRRYGFQDPPRFMAALNGETGGIAAGNGRMRALVQMHAAGEPPPANIAVTDDGAWAVPMVMGNDLDSERKAMTFAIDHNNLTMTGGGKFTPLDLAEMWDYALFGDLLEELAENAPEAELPVTLDAKAIEQILAGELDEPAPKWAIKDPRQDGAAPDLTDKPLPNTQCSLNGQLIFTIQRDVYRAWQEDLRIEVSFEPDVIAQEILRRLGLDDD